MQRRVPPGHGTESSILYLHSPTVRPNDVVRLSGDPLIQDSLSGQGGRRVMGYQQVAGKCASPCGVEEADSRLAAALLLGGRLCRARR